ncbi:MAG: ATP-binding cassette domain-containing protein [Hyphomicrobiales bacterium]
MNEAALAPMRAARARRTPAAGAPLIEARDVSLSYGGRRVLDGVDLTIAPGEIVTLIGPNGAGKSSLVKVLLGLVKPDAGTVVRAAGLSVGYVPQKFAVHESIPLTVARLVTLTRRATDAEIDGVLGEVGIAHLKHAPVTGLSGGELQRVLIARSLVGSPRLIVLDEPVQGVDFIGEARLYDLIASIRDRHACGVLMVSHDLHVVMAASDRVICLNAHVCCHGVPEAVQIDPEFVRLFGSEAAKSLAVYSHAHDHTHDIGGEPHDHTGHDHHGHDHHDHHHHHHHDHGKAR